MNKGRRLAYLCAFLLLLLVAPRFSWAEEPATCSGLYRTLGSEWEVVKLTKPEDEDRSARDASARRITRGFFPDRERLEPSATVLSVSRFPKLYSFWGRSSSGSLVEHFIPQATASKEAVREALAKSPSVKYHAVEGGIVLDNFAELSGPDLARILEKIVRARGRDQSNLKLAKAKAAWENPNAYDSMTDPLVHEEWRGEASFVGFEFAMNRGAHSWDELVRWHQNLWGRLGLTHEENIAPYMRTGRNHIHWRMAVPAALSPANRARVFKSIKGFWGDRNDAFWIRLMSTEMNENKLNAEGILPLEEHNYLEADAFFQGLSNYSIAPLTRSTYDRLRADTTGLHVDDAAKDIELSVDGTFPPAFKRLAMGLRGAKGEGQKVGHGGSVVQLEARSMGESTKENLLNLPKIKEGSDEVDVESLLKFGSEKSRGLEGRVEQIKDRMTALSITPEIVDEANAYIATIKNYWGKYSWTEEQIRGVLFAPLNEWLGHPLVENSLRSLPPAERKSKLRRYEVALQRYKTRIEELYKAKTNKFHQIELPWLPKPHIMLDGGNRVFERGTVKGLDKDEIKLSYDTNAVFNSGLYIEARRFCVESGLQDLVSAE